MIVGEISREIKYILIRIIKFINRLINIYCTRDLVSTLQFIYQTIRYIEIKRDHYNFGILYLLSGGLINAVLILFIGYLMLSISIYLIRYIDSLIYFRYIGLKLKICGFYTNYVETVYNFSKKIEINDKNYHCLYYTGKILSILFITLCVIPLFYPILLFSLILGIIFHLDVIEFLNEYFILMDGGSSGNSGGGFSGGGPSGNFGGPSGGGGPFGGGPSTVPSPTFDEYKESTKESNRPQGEFPFTPPSDEYMKALRNNVSEFHYRKIEDFRREFPNAHIRDWSALKLFDHQYETGKSGYYYVIGANTTRVYKHDYPVGAFHKEEIDIYHHGTKNGIKLGRQPFPDVTGIFYNSGSRRDPILTQYNPEAIIDHVGRKVVYVDKGIGRGLEPTKMYLTCLSKRTIKTARPEAVVVIT